MTRRKKIASGILAAVVAVVAVFLIVVALRPDEFRVVRSATLAVPADVAFAQVNDFHQWAAWSPWARLDPAAKNSFDGPPSGTGAGFGWSGNNDVGEGRMTITESRPNELVRIRLEFTRPPQTPCTTEFTFTPDGQGTRVTWSMFGRYSFMEKSACLFMNIDKIVGGDFERGLAQMKAATEGAARK